MKSSTFLVIISYVAIAYAIEPIVIVHGGAGSVAASRVKFKIPIFAINSAVNRNRASEIS